MFPGNVDGGKGTISLCSILGRRKGFVSKNREALKGLQSSNEILSQTGSFLDYRSVNSFCRADHYLAFIFFYIEE